MVKSEVRKQYFEVVDASHLGSSVKIGDINFSEDDFPLRYGLTPKYTAAKVFVQHGYDGPSAITAERIQDGGEKIRSYGNIEDWDTGIRLVQNLNKAFPDEEYVAFMKHGMPFQVAKDPDLGKAYQLAFDVDTIIKFGSVVAFSGIIDDDIAEHLTHKDHFFDGVIAKGYTTKAIELMKRKPNMRVLQEPKIRERIRDHGCEIKDVTGGILIADRHRVKTTSPDQIIPLSKIEIGDDVKKTALFQWLVNASGLRSNSANFGDGNIVYGIGTGCGSRVDAIRQALKIADSRSPYYKKWLKNQDFPLVLASDGFPPENDSVESCYDYDIKYIITPKGSLKDETIKERAEELGIICLTTESNERPFVHR
jgi:phosphoribosylaminoimidazolecarboxamide formyltransferase/IMP cyclohydrolase